jgi:quercetin dioxygenase-like cupin family protein
LTPEDDVDRGETIDRIWDQIAQGHADVAGDLDPADTATIRYLHAHDDRTGPNPVFRRHLREELMHAPAIPVSSQPSRLLVSNGRASQPRWDAPQALPAANRRWTVAPLATAALLVLTLVGGFLVSGTGRSGRQALAPLLLPAISGTPTATLQAEGSEPVAETLLDTTFADLPDGSSSVLLEPWTFKPGADALVMPPFAAPRAVIAGEGSFEIRLDGEEHSLQPGESLVVPAGQELVVRNATQSQATLLHVGVMSEYPPVQFDTAFITYRYAIATSGKMPAGATRMVLERLTMAPGSSLPPFTLAENQWVGVGEGTVRVTLAGDRLPLYWESGEEREFARDYFPAIAAGTDVTLRNAGDDQLVLYRLTFTPGDSEAAGTPLAGPVSYKNPLS